MGIFILGLACQSQTAGADEVGLITSPIEPLPPVNQPLTFAQFSLPNPRPREAVSQDTMTTGEQIGLLTLAELESLALQHNPTLVQSSARVRAAEGRWLQAGLYPNPIIGYQASEIGNEGRSGQQGAFLSQELVRRRKRQLGSLSSRREVAQLQQAFATQRWRVLNDVRTEHFNVLVAQRAVELMQHVALLSGRVLEATQQLYRGQIISYSDVLQAKIQAKTADVTLASSLNRRAAAWRRLSSVIGVPQMAPRSLQGNLQPRPDEITWDDALARLLAESPELAAARIEVARRRSLLERARVEPLPNLFVQMGLQRDNATQDTITNVQVGLPIPLFNANQGNIQTAFADLRRAKAEVARVELKLHTELASAFEIYSNARNEVEQFSREILPDARTSLELVTKGYQQQQFNFLTVLTAERTYATASLAYLQALQQLGISRILIEGLMLSGSLRESHHIEVPQVEVRFPPVFGPGRPPVEQK